MTEHNERIRQLIESGEAVNEEGAEEALREEEDAAFFRKVDYKAYRAELNQALRDPVTPDPERWVLRFRKAIVDTGRTPDELEWLLYRLRHYLAEGETADPVEQHRREATRRRLEAKGAALEERIGAERTKELNELYWICVQKLFDGPNPKEGRREEMKCSFCPAEFGMHSELESHEAGHKVKKVSDVPLTYLLDLPDGCTPGRWEAAVAFAEVVAELRKSHSRPFQFVPFSYSTDGGLEAILAIGHQQPFPG